MNELEAINQRHSVRNYKEDILSNDIVNELNNEIKTINEMSGLNITLITNERKAFQSFLAHYGNFKNANNYFALIGNKNGDAEKLAGYFGEKLVLKAQEMGLNTCWVALTVSKRFIKKICKINKNEKLICVISIGYGLNNGFSRKSKSFNDVAVCEGTSPDWFVKGVNAALMAPTAMNQQNFKLILKNNNVELICNTGVQPNLNYGIIKYHFEVGAGRENFNWK